MKFPISYFHLNPNKKRMFRIGHIDVPEHIMSLIAFKQASDPFKKELRNNFFSKESIYTNSYFTKTLWEFHTRGPRALTVT